MNNIDDLEYRIWRLQGEVNQTILNFEQSDHINLNRLNHMEAEISYLQSQVAELKSLGQKRALSSMQPQPMSQPQPSVQPQPMGQPLPTVGTQSFGQPFAQGEPLSPGRPLPTGELKKKDLEKTLGTGIMGIVASILIFISIIIFGGLLLPYLTDAVMTAMMFLLSFILFGVGYVLLRKNPKNKFHISLCACGATALCVSLFVTRLYFALINDSVFLLLIAVWLALMAYVGRKYQNYIFRIIGEIGVFLTVCLGTVRLTADDMADGGFFMFSMLLIVFGCSTFILHYIIPRISYEKNAFSHSIRTLVLLLTLLVFAGKTEISMGAYAGFAVVTAFLLCEIYVSCRDILNDGCLFYSLMSIDSLIYCAIFCTVFRLESFLPYYITAVLAAGLFEIKRSKNSYVGNIIASLLFLWSGWAWLHGGVFYAVLVVLPLFAYGYVKKNAAFRYIGLFGMVGIFGAEITIPAALLLWVIPFAGFVILARIVKDQIFTAVGYPLFMVCGAGVFWELLHEFGFPASENIIIVFLVSAVLHILLIKLRIFDEDRSGFEIVAAVMTVSMMLFASYAVYQEYLNIFTMLVMAALYTMNTVNLLKRSENFGYYIGFKYTVCMILLVDAHFELSMLISVLMLLFAAGSIVFGFYKSYKSFRIYGLILSMVSVFKLILFDVSNKSTVYNAVGFLICGLICFGISFLYNKIENKVKKKIMGSKNSKQVL